MSEHSRRPGNAHDEQHQRNPAPIIGGVDLANRLDRFADAIDRLTLTLSERGETDASYMGCEYAEELRRIAREIAP